MPTAKSKQLGEVCVCVYGLIHTYARICGPGWLPVKQQANRGPEIPDSQNPCGCGFIPRHTGSKQPELSIPVTRRQDHSLQPEGTADDPRPKVRPLQFGSRPAQGSDRLQCRAGVRLLGLGSRRAAVKFSLRAQKRQTRLCALGHGGALRI